jgi:4-hydroxy-3-methylbut-2-enyl diphosphate reductase
MEIVLAQPRGFCAGVGRAIEIVERALALHGRPVYVYHEIVHNGYVVKDLAERGAVFVNDIDSIPRGAITVFSAHGVSHAVVDQARQRGLQVIDATCPLVAKVHRQAELYTKLRYEIVIIGHSGHEEVEGTMGSVDGPVHVVATIDDVQRLTIDPSAKVAYVTQTTLSPDDTREIIDALMARYPHAIGPELDDICYATLNRQRAVRDMAKQVDLVLVVGARNSSNSNRLREVAAQNALPAYLIEDASEIDPAWLKDVGKVGVTAGASTPEILVTGVRERLATLGATNVRQMPGAKETLQFRLPPLLRKVAV